MKKISLFVIGLVLINTIQARAAEQITQPALVEALDTLLIHSGVAEGFVGQGWVGEAAIIRCNDPQGTLDPSDKKHCALASIENYYSPEETVTGDPMTALLFSLTDNSKVMSGYVLQGWVGRAGILRCLTPAGTGNRRESKHCKLDHI